MQQNNFTNDDIIKAAMKIAQTMSPAELLHWEYEDEKLREHLGMRNVLQTELGRDRLQFVTRFLKIAQGIPDEALAAIIKNPQAIAAKLAKPGFDFFEQTSEEPIVIHPLPETTKQQLWDKKVIGAEDISKFRDHVPKKIPGCSSVEVMEHQINVRLNPLRFIHELGGEDNVRNSTLTFSQILKLARMKKGLKGARAKLLDPKESSIFLMYNTINELVIIQLIPRFGYNNYRMYVNKACEKFHLLSRGKLYIRI